MPRQRSRNRLAKIAIALIFLGMTSISFYLKIANHLILPDVSTDTVLDRPEVEVRTSQPLPSPSPLHLHTENATGGSGTISIDEEPEEDELDPFATQSPKGKRWTSPYKHKNRNAEHWWRNSDSCFEVDNICRSSRNQWFYFHHTNGTAVLHQPTLELKYPPYEYRRAAWADTRIRMSVLSTSRTKLGSRHDTCHLSSTPNHVVLQSSFNDMVGEFYIRILLNLHALFTTNEYHHNSSTSSGERNFLNLFRKSPVKHGIQFYLHVPLENKGIVDAHKLLLSGLLPPTNEIKNHTPSVRWTKAAIDLIRPRNKTCECFKKLVFCGYNVYSQQNKISATPSNTKDGSSGENETNYTLWTGKYVDVFGQNLCESYACNAARDVASNPYHCDAYAKLRNDLIANIELSRFPNATQIIIEYRKKLLLRRQLIDIHYEGDTKEWTFVGLTQRKLRRTWLNLASATDACNSNFNQENLVVCLETNVEKTESPLAQYIMYRSLDVCIGVHGAQLTQAIFMPQNSHVLELLPWIPTYARGDWVKSTQHPTPLGIIFHNTELNHYGYSLGRNSTILCQDVTLEDEKDCFMSKENEWKFTWDNRNFVVDSAVVLNFIKSFVLPIKMKPQQCNDLLDGRPSGFTLYNIRCKDELTNKTLMHYYHDGISDEVTHDNKNNKKQSIFTRCPTPHNTASWNYYSALVDTNARAADRARRMTEGSSPKAIKGEDRPSHRIPHRLIFTHKDNLFNCDKSASNSTKPDLYNLAENAKATVNAYSQIWPDLEYKFLTDADCVDAINKTEQGLVPWFNNPNLAGMFKADICRAADLTLHGGYYFDVDVLVVRPYVAPPNVTFATVRGDSWPKYGFFQAFLAAEKGNPIVSKSLKVMLDALYGDREQGKYLGPTALMEAWMEVSNHTDPWDFNKYNSSNGAHFLTEVPLDVPKKLSKYKRLSNVMASKDGLNLMQHVPAGHGDQCQFSSGACNVVVIDEFETIYFYSRILGTTWCGKRVYEHDECMSDRIDLKSKAAAGVQWDFYCASTLEDLKVACSSRTGVKCTPVSARHDCGPGQGCMQIQCKSFSETSSVGASEQPMLDHVSMPKHNTSDDDQEEVPVRKLCNVSLSSAFLQHLQTLDPMPKKVHILFPDKNYWRDQPPLPFVNASILSLMRLNPNWNVTVYDDEMVDNVIRRAATQNVITQKEANMLVGETDDAGNVVQPSAHVVERSDIVRLLLIYIEGGVYMDVDTLVSRKMEDILKPHTRRGLPTKDNVNFVQNIMCSSPGNALFLATIRDASNMRMKMERKLGWVRGGPLYEMGPTIFNKHIYMQIFGGDEETHYKCSDGPQLSIPRKLLDSTNGLIVTKREGVSCMDRFFTDETVEVCEVREPLYKKYNMKSWFEEVENRWKEV